MTRKINRTIENPEKRERRGGRIVTDADLERIVPGKNGVTHLIFIIDRSGSMAPLRDDTIGGFNSLLEKQKKEDGQCVVTTVFFNHESEVIHDRIALGKTDPITTEDYIPAGSTALFDAIGETLTREVDIRKYGRNEDVPEKTMVVITTDGMENASRNYGGRDVKELVETLRNKGGWEFVFLGANIDAIGAAGDIGISASRAANYCADEVGTQVLYRTVCKAVNSFRKSSCLEDSWKNDVEEDAKRN